MKKLICIAILTVAFSLVNAQRSIDALFNRYADSKGFVTVTISGDLLKLASLLDENKEDDPLPHSITEIRILAQEDHDLKVENFYDLVIKDININDYEEFMRVRESDQDLRILARADGNRFSEFLLIAGGEDNVLIQVKGNLTLKEAKKLSSDFKSDHGRRALISN